MNCEDAWGLISARVDGELAAGDAPALDAHLAECAACRSVLDAVKVRDSDLGRAFAQGRRRARAVAERAIGGLPLRRRSATVWPWVLVPASAAAGFAAALLLRPEPGPGDAPRVVSPRVEERTPPRLDELPPPAPPAKPLLLVAVADGQVEVQTGGEWRPVAAGAGIEAGARVRTGPDGACGLEMVDGSEVALNGGTEVAFPSVRRLEIERGQLGSTVAPGEGAFEVRAGDAVVTAIGTRFDLAMRPGETVLTVLEGAARVARGRDDEVVERGQAARIHPDRIEKGPAGSVLFATRWVVRLLKKKGEDNPDLAFRVSLLLAEIGRDKAGHLSKEELLELGASCAKPLLSFVRSPISRLDKDRRQLASDVLLGLAEKGELPASETFDLIQLLLDESGGVRVNAARSLELITGQDQGRSAESWRKDGDPANAEAARKWLEWWRKQHEERPTKV